MARALKLNEVLPFLIGPSRCSLSVSSPMLSAPWYLCISPSLVRTSTMDEQPAVAGGKGAFEECGVLHCFGREDGEDTHQVVGVVDRDAVQHHQILVGASAAHVHAGKALHAGLHAGHQLDGLQQVSLPEYGGGVLDLCHRYLMCSHGCTFYAGFPLVREHYDLCQLVMAVQSDVEQGVFRQPEPAVPAFVAQVGENQFRFPFRQGEGIETERIGGSTCGTTTLKDIGTNQRLGRRSVGHVSADSELTANGFLRHGPLMEQNVLSGYLERDGFVFKGTLQYLTDVLLFHLQCDAVRELYFFPIDEGESGCVFQVLHEALQGCVSDA